MPTRRCRSSSSEPPPPAVRAEASEHGEGRGRGPGPDQRLPRSRRLLSAREFRRVYARGARLHGKALTIVALWRTAPGFRVGVSVSKDHGPAVIRNKIKRLLREAFRIERAGLPGQFDLVLIPRVREGKHSLAELRSEIATLLRKAPHGARQGRSGRRRRPGDAGGAGRIAR